MQPTAERAPANLPNLLLSIVSSTIFLLVPGNCLQHKNALDPLNPPFLSRLGTHAVLNFEVIAPLCFPPVESKLTTHRYSITSDEKMVEF